MDWARTHPYTAALIGAGILIVLGTFIVFRKAAVETAAPAPRAWGGVGGNLLNPISNAVEQGTESPESLYSQIRSGPPFFYGTVAQTTSGAENADDFDFDAFLATLSERPKGSVSSGNDNALLDAVYSFIPQGLISTTTPTKVRTPAEQALYDYGNEVGADIQTFEDTHRSAPRTLKNQLEDSTDPAKNAAVLELAASLSRLGEMIGGIENIPETAAPAGQRLAESYREMGEKLALVPGAKTEEALLGALLAYNATVEIFTKNFVALATLFSAYGVSFGPDEPGSVFTFSAASF